MRLMEPGVIQDSLEGNVSAATLGNKLRSKDPVGFMRGRNAGDLYDAARLGKAFPASPDSWTATRLALPLVSGGALGAYDLSQGGDPVDAGLLAIAPVVGSALLGRSYNNPLTRQYLSRGLLPRTTAVPHLLGRAGAVHGGLLGAQP